MGIVHKMAKAAIPAIFGFSFAALAAITPIDGHGSAKAASYDCAKGNLTGTEVTICDSPRLSAMDTKMVNLYYHELRGAQPAFVSEQHKAQEAWLKERNACGTDKACLTEAYSRRINALEKFD
ncbi:lysozyme inhibitor LprI family protein [Martelella mangrovi]|uniref:Lysozyme inhibitor LprI N-terminal domain-containing protein n=1 Tax=Martelella mangrovi TaxID=1397477 RepID=A0ABV2I869_9HYPH